MSSKSLQELGWSQQSIADVIGSTRPAVKKRLEGEKLPLEQEARFNELHKLQEPYKSFVESALWSRAKECIWRPAWIKLAKESEGSDE